jgi:hypothetical protein
MQRTADVPHQVAHAGFPQADRLFEPTAAFDAAVNRLEADAPPSKLPIPRFLCPRPLVPTRLLRGLAEVHAAERERLKARILQPLTPWWQRRGGGSGDAFVMATTRMRLAHAEDAQGAIDQEQVFQPVPLFLAAITRFRLRRVVGARDGSLGAVMPNRGAPGGGVLCPASAGDLSGDSAGPSTSRRACKAATLREGACPMRRRVLRHTGSKTCIHGVALDWRMPNTRPCRSGVGCCLRETRIHNRRSSGVGSGQFLSVI